MQLPVAKGLVRAHRREQHPVRAYVRRGLRKAYTEAQRAAMDEAHNRVRAMAIGRVVTTMQAGTGMHFPDDAVLDATEAGLHAVAQGRPPAKVRTRVYGAIKNHVAWERTHGVTGQRVLLRDYYRAATPERRAELAALLPRFEAETQLNAAEVPGVEEQLIAAGDRLSRDAILDAVERRFQINLERVRHLLRRERDATLHAAVAQAVERDIAMFERHLQGFSFREIGAEFGVSHMTAKRAYETLLGQMRQLARAEMREVEPPAARRAEKALRLNDVAQDRLLRAFARHVRATQSGLPMDFLNTNRYLLAELLLEPGDYL